MERINNLTGKIIPKTLPFLEYVEGKICDECGEKKIVYNCFFCGAPICCHNCGCLSLISEDKQMQGD